MNNTLMKHSLHPHRFTLFGLMVLLGLIVSCLVTPSVAETWPQPTPIPTGVRLIAQDWLANAHPAANPTTSATWSQTVSANGQKVLGYQVLQTPAQRWDAQIRWRNVEPIGAGQPMLIRVPPAGPVD